MKVRIMKSRIKSDSWLLNTPIAHRGLHNETYGENSMGAYKNAIENGCPIEMDIQLSKDGVLLCFHDDSLERVCGKKAFINDLTYEEIKQLKILNTQEGVPTFEEFLKVVDGKVPLLIEIKLQRSKQYDIALKTVEALKGYKGEFVIQSFDPRIMGKVRKYAPSIIRGQLACKPERKSMTFIKYLVVRYMLLNCVSKPDFIHYALNDMPIKTNKPTICWTIRTKEDLAKARKLGVNFVFETVNPNE